MNGIFCPFVRLSACPSLSPYSLCSHRRIIMKLSRVITNDQSEAHAKGQVQRSKLNVTEVKTQLNRFQTITTIWIHIWWWNDAQGLMLDRRGVLLFSRSSVKFQGHTVDVDPNWAFSDRNSSLNSQMMIKWWTVTPIWIQQWLRNEAHSWKQHRRGAQLFLKVIRQTSRSHGTKKIADFDPNWAYLDCK